MPQNENREYRALSIVLPDEETRIVEGHASTWDTYTLATIDGVDYNECIERGAFEGADMSDVVFRVDHAGRVYARTSNGSLTLDVDERGLVCRADLSRTSGAMDLYDDIKAGNYSQMSFAFVVSEDSYDRQTHTRTIKKIKKVYDVSPVTWSANPNTNISARGWIDGAIETERAERLAAEQRKRTRKALEIKLKLEV